MNDLIRVMLCDDSATMRRLIKKAIEHEPRIRVVAQAKNGKDALRQIDIANPDAIILDVEMPIMDGIDTAKGIRQKSRSLPIIMFSSLTSRGAEATLDALQAGANDFCTKPTSAGHVDEAIKQVRRELVPKLIAWATKKKNIEKPTLSAVSPAEKKPGSFPRKSLSAVSAIAIGVSTGGPAALTEIFQKVPSGFKVPFLVAQHMPPVFTGLLAERLSQQTGHNVIEGSDGQPLTGGQIVIAPGDYHLVVKRQGTQVVTCLNQDPLENSCRPAVDPLFRSVAECYGQKALGVVLTGMGQDGTNGAEKIKALGGSVFIQDEASSVVWGMPRKVYESGFADQMLPLDELANEIAAASRGTVISHTSSSCSLARG